MKEPTVGFIGLGWLGRPMAERLLAQGFPVIAFNRTPSKAEALVEHGARVAGSPAEVAGLADVVITVVGDDAALQAVCFGPKGLVGCLPRRATHLQMSTVSRGMTVRVAKAVHGRGAHFLDAPVLGSGPQAIEGSLILMIGGQKEILENNRTVLEALGSKIIHTGEVGSASQMKLVANQFIASMMLAFSQGMVLAQKAGISPKLVLDVLDASALHSPFYRGKLKRLENRGYQPNFPLKWMLKDIHLVLEAGAELGVSLPGVAAAREVYVSAVAHGLADLDYSAIIETMEQWAGGAAGPIKSPLLP